VRTRARKKIEKRECDDVKEEGIFRERAEENFTAEFSGRMKNESGSIVATVKYTALEYRRWGLSTEKHSKRIV